MLRLITLILLLVFTAQLSWSQGQPVVVLILQDGTSRTELTEELQRSLQSVALGSMLRKLYYLKDPNHKKFLDSLDRQFPNPPYICFGKADIGGPEQVQSLSWSEPFTGSQEAVDLLKAHLTQVGLLAAPASVTPVVIQKPAEPLARLTAGSRLDGGDILVSFRQGYCFAVQRDGNCVIYNQAGGNRPVWGLGVQAGGAYLELSRYGRLRLVAPGGNVVWAAGDDNPNYSHFLEMQDDGNLCLYRTSGSGANPHCVWSSKSEGAKYLIR